MPGSGGHYGVMGRSQDHRSSMFGSSLNLNGEYFTTLYECSDMIFMPGICCARIYLLLKLIQSIISDKIVAPVKRVIKQNEMN